MSQHELDNMILSCVGLVHQATLAAVGKDAGAQAFWDTMNTIREVSQAERTLWEGQGQLALAGVRDRFKRECGSGFERWLADRRREERATAEAISHAFARLLFANSGE